MTDFTKPHEEYRVQRRYPPTEGTSHPGWGEAGASASSRGTHYRRLAYAIRSAENALDEYRSLNARNAQCGLENMVRRIEYRVIDSKRNVLWQSSTDTPSLDPRPPDDELTDEGTPGRRRAGPYDAPPART